MVQAQSYTHQRDQLSRSDQMLCNMDDYTWDEEPSMVIDFDGEDEDYLFVYNGNNSSMSVQLNECEPIMNWRTHSFNNTLKMDHKCFEFAATSLKGMLFKDHEGISKTKLLDQQGPCLDSNGESVLRTVPDMRRPFFEFPYPTSSDNGKEGCEIMSLDQKMEIAQRKLEDSIRRSQLTRPKFIQLSERILKDEACATLLREIELDRLKQPISKFNK
jgi:hypothetical protein